MSDSSAGAEIVWLLSLDSVRSIDLVRRTSLRVSGTTPANPREAGPEPRVFEAMAPWPPVPGCPMTIIWSSDEDRLRLTVTAPTIAAWTGRQCRGWQSMGRTVMHRSTPILHAVTDEVAHGLAVVLGGPQVGVDRTAPFSSHGRAVCAGRDVLAHATSDAAAEAVAARLAAHPAAAVLGAGLAVAADEACGAYRLDPSWLLRHDDRPWVDRVEAALSAVGCEARCAGNEHNATVTCRYRGVGFTVEWHAGTATIHLSDVDTPIAVVAPGGPIAGAHHGISLIDLLPDASLLAVALDQNNG